MNMKAAVLHGIEHIRYEDYEKPIVEPGTVLVHVKACGICGSDIPRYFKGTVKKYPLVLGHEFSGIVEEIGLRKFIGRRKTKRNRRRRYVCSSRRPYCWRSPSSVYGMC